MHQAKHQLSLNPDWVCDQLLHAPITMTFCHDGLSPGTVRQKKPSLPSAALVRDLIRAMREVTYLEISERKLVLPYKDTFS